MKRAWPGLVAAAAVFIAGLFLTRGTRDLPLDDAYIHLTFARNLAQGHGFSFNPGEFSLGFSSPLWVLGMAGAARLKLDPIPSARLLSIAFMAISALLIYLVTLNSLIELRSRIFLPAQEKTRPSGWEQALAAASALGLAATGHLLWLAGLGMEPSLFLGLGLASILLLVRDQPRPIAGGLMLGLAALTRTLGLILIPLILLLMSRRIAALDRRGRIRMGLGLGLALLLPAAWSLYSYFTVGFIAPPTRAGKLASDLFNSGLAPKGMFVYAARHLHWLWKFELGVIWLIFITIAGSIMFIWFSISRRQETERGKNKGAGALIWVALETPAAALALWAALHFLAHALWFRSTELITPYNNLRYHVMLVPALFSAAAASLWVMALIGSRTSDSKQRSFVCSIIALLFLISPLVIEAAKLPSWRTYYHRDTEHLDKVHKAAALWLEKNSPGDSRLACLDVGLLGFYSDRYVIDLGGLTDPEVLPVLEANHTWEYMAEKRATHYLELVRHPSDRITGVVSDQKLRRYQLIPLEQFNYPYFPQPCYLHSFGLQVFEVRYLRSFE